jgi:hypothetical protein
VSAIHVLPSALREVARQAEQTDEFTGFVDDLADHFAVVGEEDCYEVVADVMRRAGSYDSICPSSRVFRASGGDFWPCLRPVCRELMGHPWPAPMRHLPAGGPGQ